MLIDSDGIAARIPHAGAMCLLDGVERYDATRIVCVASSHRSPDNPMRREGRLGVLCGIEYASQAMALHAALQAPSDGAPARGYLASLRSVSFHEDRLDLVAGDLTAEAACVHHENGRAVYDFAVKDGDRALLEGRAVVVIETARG